MNITNVDVSSACYTHGRKDRIKYGIIHSVSAKNIKGYAQNPYDINAILDLFIKKGPIDKFSCHYLIDRDGSIYCMVPYKDTAWHAGVSVIQTSKGYEVNLNNSSVGIELVGKEGDPFTTVQYDRLTDLAIYLEMIVLSSNLGQIDHWVGHDWIAGQISVSLKLRAIGDIKKDPGPLFNWDMFLKEKYYKRYFRAIDQRNSAKIKELETFDMRKMTALQLINTGIKKIFKND